MLRAAGLDCAVDPAGIDETAIKDRARHETRPVMDAVAALARAKALDVSSRRAGAWVIGADQILVCGDRWFDKPADRAKARANLQALSGREHRLHSAVSVVRDGDEAWCHDAVATLTVRSLSDGFIDAYLAAMGEAALRSVGSYEIEGLGAQLFSRVEGDPFVIMGMPLLPLLAFFRGVGVMAE
jgi:septum formation protein